MRLFALFIFTLLSPLISASLPSSSLPRPLVSHSSITPSLSHHQVRTLAHQNVSPKPNRQQLIESNKLQDRILRLRKKQSRSQHQLLQNYINARESGNYTPKQLDEMLFEISDNIKHQEDERNAHTCHQIDCTYFPEERRLRQYYESEPTKRTDQTESPAGTDSATEMEDEINEAEIDSIAGQDQTSSFREESPSNVEEFRKQFDQMKLNHREELEDLQKRSDELNSEIEKKCQLAKELRDSRQQRKNMQENERWEFCQRFMNRQNAESVEKPPQTHATITTPRIQRTVSASAVRPAHPLRGNQSMRSVRTVHVPRVGGAMRLA